MLSISTIRLIYGITFNSDTYEPLSKEEMRAFLRDKECIKSILSDLIEDNELTGWYTKNIKELRELLHRKPLKG